MPSRYDALSTYLTKQPERSVTLSFETVEGILGGPLPASARRHRAWWGNDLGPGRQSRGWRGVGWVVVTVQLKNGLVTFHKRERKALGPSEIPEVPMTDVVLAVEDLRESVDRLTTTIAERLDKLIERLR